MLMHAVLRDRGASTTEYLIVQDLYITIISLFAKKHIMLAACTRVALYRVLELYVKVSCSEQV